MIKFIDLRGQKTGYRFAFYNTIPDRFIEISGTQAWDIFDDFAEDCSYDTIIHSDFIDRCRSIAPQWCIEREEL